jgi:hypothetical protein
VSAPAQQQADRAAGAGDGAEDAEGGGALAGLGEGHRELAKVLSGVEVLLMYS